MALTEEQLELLGNRLVPLFQQFERAVINDVARRLVKTGRLTETAEIMAETLRDKGFSPSAIRTQVMKLINADKQLQEEIAANTLAVKQVVAEEIKALRENARVEAEGLWEDAGNMAFHEDLSVWEGDRKPVRGTAFEKLIEATAKRATDELLNLTKSTGFRTASGDLIRAQQAYTREVNLAFVKVASGAYSYGQAVEEAVRELARSGMRSIDFESGVTRQLDTAVRNAVMTASSQLAGQITMQNVEQTGVDYVEVSAHWGAREGEGHANHAGWQGRVYRVQGADAEYENLEEATGYPSDPKGLCGYNCRHTFYPFWPGISEPTEWEKEPGPFELDGRTYTYYQATQEQRRREREIRALKREEAAFEAAGLKDKAKETARKIRLKTVEYKEFSENVGIRAKTERLRVCEGLKTGAKSGIILSKKAQFTPPPMDSRRYIRMKNALEKQKIKVQEAQSDDLAFLEYMGAEAMCIGTDMILHKGPVPSASAMFEELIHNYQNRQLGEADGGDYVERARREVEANRKLLRNAALYGFTEQDAADIKKNLDIWEKDYESRAGEKYVEP